MSSPEAWECSQCGQLWGKEKRCTCSRWMFAKMIPCFTELAPEDRIESTWSESGGATAVCIAQGPSCAWLSIGGNEKGRWANLEVDGNLALGRGEGIQAVIGRTDLPGAVLWIKEARKP